jgi:AcrR family transcriptional regulator
MATSRRHVDSANIEAVLTLPTSRGRDRRAAAPAERYHHGDLCRALLRSAEKLLHRAGPAALSLRKIARAAGVSHNAPYRHFTDRDALLAALAAEGFRRLAAALAEAAAAAPPHGRLQATGRAYLAFARANSALYLLMFGPGLRRSGDPELHAAALSALEALRGAAADTGSPAPGSRAARHGAVGAWALVHGLAHLIADGQLSEDLAADGGAALAETALAAYAAGLRGARD